ncbi:MAG: aminotransferase class III-fold pyridoxal phosphate-dependent enzyme [Xanthomonadales bacterium]|nr:aminotransferase class III-fold pyridoxal phosphate-dependent enzyme [Xanthomonadales bacterium]
MSLTGKLEILRNAGGPARTTGLPDQALAAFADDAALRRAVERAHDAFNALREERPEFVALSEDQQLQQVSAGFVNFYPDDAVNPYLAIAADGPWIISLKGAVIYDAGGYGMLGLGHSPDRVVDAMSRPQAMANIMTPAFSQLRFVEAMQAEIGHTRTACPYAKFLCLNSGSESVTLAARIADVNARIQTGEDGRHAGKPIRRLAIKGGFHGRTDLPARYSDSTRKAYLQHLASWQGREHDLITIDPYDVGQLRQVFADAAEQGFFIEAMFIEPVMGEGDPGKALTPEFYAVARELTGEHGTVLLVDSIQAGLRAHGVLSIVDYPGFEQLPPPDMETFSKALNAGQYPMSVLAVTAHAGELYRKGIYGNTMTANPRALDVASTVLAQVDPELRINIRERGQECVDKLQALADELGGLITRVQGTGLLFSCELSPQFKCYGADSTEEYLREHGLGVIHGGANSLRFTPHFAITSAEIDLMVDSVRRALTEGPRLAVDKVQAEAGAA